jgi:hypothetical protein
VFTDGSEAIVVATIAGLGFAAAIAALPHWGISFLVFLVAAVGVVTVRRRS